MVLCCVVVCSKRSGRDNVKFFGIPAVITHRGEQERELSNRRRREFLAAIGRADLKGTKLSNARICSLHFVSGSPANLFDDTNVDWVPTMKLRLRGPQKANELEESVEQHKRRTKRAQQGSCRSGSSSRRNRKSRSMSSPVGAANEENGPEPTENTAATSASLSEAQNSPVSFTDLPVAYTEETLDVDSFETGGSGLALGCDISCQTEITAV